MFINFKVVIRWVNINAPNLIFQIFLAISITTSLSPVLEQIIDYLPLKIIYRSLSENISHDLLNLIVVWDRALDRYF